VIWLRSRGSVPSTRKGLFYSRKRSSRPLGAQSAFPSTGKAADVKLATFLAEIGE